MVKLASEATWARQELRIRLRRNNEGCQPCLVPTGILCHCCFTFPPPGAVFRVVLGCPQRPGAAMCFFIAAHFFVTRPSAITARGTISQCCLATNPGIIFPFLKITLSTIRAASRCRVRFPVTGVGNCPFFGNDLLNIDDGPVSRAGDLCGRRVLRHRAVAHIVHVEDPSWFARKQGGVLVLRRGHDGIPICHLRAFIQHKCC